MRYKLLLLLISSTFTAIQGGVKEGEHVNGIGGGPVNYKFEYGVGDPQTNDYKSQYEYRDGDYVVGQYEVKEADGTKRIVKYRSGPDTGFEAVVEKVGQAIHPPSGGGEKSGGSGGSYLGGFAGHGGGFGGMGGLGYMGFGGMGGFDMLKSGFGGFKGAFGGFGGYEGGIGGIGGNSYVGSTHWGKQGHGGYGGHGFGGLGMFGGQGGFLGKL